jgi:small subunit ribosomal protein S19
MSRAKWKGPFIDIPQFNKIEQLKLINPNLKKKIIINRNSNIVPLFLGSTFKVYNGKSYTEVTVTDSMIGHKFGEFSFTRVKFIFKKKKSKK